MHKEIVVSWVELNASVLCWRGMLDDDCGTVSLASRTELSRDLISCAARGLFYDVSLSRGGCAGVGMVAEGGQRSGSSEVKVEQVRSGQQLRSGNLQIETRVTSGIF